MTPIATEDLKFLVNFIWTQVPTDGPRRRMIKVIAALIGFPCVLIAIVLCALWFHGSATGNILAGLAFLLGGIGPIAYAFDWSGSKLAEAEVFARRFVALLATPDLYRYQSTSNPTMMVFETAPAVPSVPAGIAPVRSIFGRKVEVLDSASAPANRLEIPVTSAEKIWDFLEACATSVPGRPPHLSDRERAAAQELVRRLKANDH